jgi:DNA-binding transcriptional ArsR family regulator
MDALSDTFFALADPTRRAILSRLSKGEAHVGELAKPFGISGPAISRHLRVLERAGLIERHVEAQRRVCRVRGPALRVAHGWLDEYRRFWEESLDRLAELLEQPDPQPSTKPSPKLLKRSLKPAGKKRQEKS